MIAALRRNIIIAKLDEANDDPRVVPEGPIDVWWRGHQNGELMLLLANLLTQNPKWRNCKIRLMRIVGAEAAREDVLKHLHGLATDSRIEVEANVFVSDYPRLVIGEQSAASAVVFLGFEMPEEGYEAKFNQDMQRLSENLPRTLFVNSTGNMKLES